MPISFGRLLTAMATPFSSDMSVDYNRAGELAVRLVDSGSDALVVSGSTGESPVLSEQEKLELFRVVVDAVGRRVPILAGTGSYNTAESMHLTKEAEKTGVQGILAVVPYYNKPPQEGLYQHFKSIAESTSLPVMLYNIPSRCVVNMLPETVVRLAAIPNIVALKESSGMMDQMSEMIRLTGPQFIVYSGDDYMALPALAIGATGVVSVASHLVGLRIKSMIASFVAGQVNDAAKEHHELMPLFKGLFITANPIPLKCAMKLTQFPIGSTRPPLPAVNDAEEHQVAMMLEKAGLI